MSIHPDQVVAAFDATHLNLYLLPTERCNFRCTYCYEDFLVGRMRAEVVGGVKHLLTNRFRDLKSLELSWFGGEPLLALGVIQDVSEHIKRLNLSGTVRYSANMTTNGYLLTVATASRLVEWGVSDFQISLDGPQATHNRTRRRADGGETFSVIWENLKGLKRTSLDLKVMLRLHYCPETLTDAQELVDSINFEFGSDPRFTVFLKAIERLGGPNDAAISLFNREEKQAAREHLMRRFNSPSKLRTISAPGETYVCYASKPNSLVIRANGDVAKCTVALYDDQNRVGKLTADGTIQVDQEKLRWWIRGFQSLKPNELSCPHGARSRDVGHIHSKV